MIDILPNELFHQIEKDLDIMDLVRLSVTCKELNSLIALDSSEYMVFLKTLQHKLFFYDLQEFVEYIKKDVETRTDDLPFASIKRYVLLNKFPDYTLTFVKSEGNIEGKDILFIITMSTSADLIEFKMLEGFIEPSPCAAKKAKLSLHGGTMEVPMFLLLAAVQVLYDAGAKSIDPNFTMDGMPAWYKKMLLTPNYTGSFFSELFSSSVTLTSSSA